MDEELKREADIILQGIGLNMSSAVNLFIRQVVNSGGLPFMPTLDRDRLIKAKRQEHLNALLTFAQHNRRIDADYKFSRDAIYDR